MQSPLEIRTLILVVTLALICRALALGYVWKLDRTYLPIRYWAIGSISMALGAFLVSLRAVISQDLSILLAHTLLIFGWMGVSGGTLIAMGRRAPWSYGITLSVVALVGVYWYMEVSPDFVLRTLVSSSPVIIFDLYVALCGLMHSGDRKTPTFHIIATLALLEALSRSFQAWHIYSTNSQVLFDPHWPVAQFYFVTIISVLLGSILFVLVAMQTLQQKLDDELAQRKRNEDALKLAATVYENSSESMMVTDSNATIVSVNPSFTRLTGYDADEAIGSKPSILKSGKHDESFYKSMWNTLLNTGSWQGEIWNRKKDGTLFLEHLTINTFAETDGRPLQHVALFHDITQERLSAETIYHQANYDRLTDLPNRYFFFEHLAKELSRARRENKSMGLVFMDLNSFKPVNDQYGHEAGDIVLKTLASRWKNCIRSTDMIARLGGDEFALVAGGLSSREEALLIARKLMKAVQAPVQINGEVQCKIGTSIGIAISPENGMEMDSLIAAADAAMYANKSKGDGEPVFASDVHSLDFSKSDWLTLDESHLTGISVIDGQHLEIVNQVNKINRILRENPSIEEIQSRLQELISYSTYHFNTESELMRQYAYPDAELHNDQHMELLEEVRRIAAHFVDDTELRLLQTIKDWLSGHIDCSDKQLGAFLQSKGVS